LNNNLLDEFANSKKPLSVEFIVGLRVP